MGEQTGNSEREVFKTGCDKLYWLFCNILCVVLVIHSPLTVLDYLYGDVIRMIILQVHIAHPRLCLCMSNCTMGKHTSFNHARVKEVYHTYVCYRVFTIVKQTGLWWSNVLGTVEHHNEKGNRNKLLKKHENMLSLACCDMTARGIIHIQQHFCFLYIPINSRDTSLCTWPFFQEDLYEESQKKKILTQSLCFFKFCFYTFDSRVFFFLLI